MCAWGDGGLMVVRCTPAIHYTLAHTTLPCTPCTPCTQLFHACSWPLAESRLTPRSRENSQAHAELQQALAAVSAEFEAHKQEVGTVLASFETFCCCAAYALNLNASSQSPPTHTHPHTQQQHQGMHMHENAQSSTKHTHTHTHTHSHTHLLAVPIDRHRLPSQVDGGLQDSGACVYVCVSVRTCAVGTVFTFVRPCVRAHECASGSVAARWLITRAHAAPTCTSGARGVVGVAQQLGLGTLACSGHKQ